VTALAEGKLLTSDQAVAQVKHLHKFHITEREKLDTVRRYWKGRQKLPAVIPSGTPGEVRHMARSSRVNVMPIVINSLVQATFVEGFRGKDDEDDVDVWDAWQANRMDKRQTSIHRAAYAYGASYATVLPGDPEPVISGVSPRMMTTLYGEDPDWPMWALEKADNTGKLWKLWDDKAIYYVQYDPTAGANPAEFIEAKEHGQEVCPVIRYVDEEDLDDEDEPAAEGLSVDERDLPVRGQVAPLMPLQDQIDLTTFALQIAQHYSGFRQRYIIGWTAETEAETLKAAANRILAIDAPPKGSGDDGEGVEVGEFAQSKLDGFIESREASLKHAATLSQTPVPELTGELVNLSAEAIALAYDSKDRKADERKTNFGESHEQMFWLVGQIKGVEIPTNSEVRWRDTSARAFAATVDGLGKIAQMLNVPPDQLWERIPGTSKRDIEAWKEAAESGNAFETLTRVLDRQGQSAG
jgi:hypothetical protein